MLSQAELIVGPWQMIAAEEAARAIQASPARKLVAPVAAPGWEWVGADPASTETQVQQMVQAVKQAAQGAAVRSRRALSVGAVVGIVVLVVFGVLIVLPSLFYVISMFFM